MPKKRKPWSSAAACRLLRLAGNPPTVEEAVEIVAARLLQGVACPPTDLDAIRPRLQIDRFEPVEDLPVSGELRKHGDQFRVVYSATLSPGRRRFTIAHELAHAVFETTGPNCPRQGGELERICDMIASELVLPRQIFAQRAGALIDAGKIYYLARVFDASIMATALRCFKLFGTSVFQIENAQVAWGYGAIRRKHDIEEVFVNDSRAAIAQAMEGVPGQSVVFLNGVAHICTWATAPGHRRTLFVIHPKNGDREGWSEIPAVI